MTYGELDTPEEFRERVRRFALAKRCPPAALDDLVQDVVSEYVVRGTDAYLMTTVANKIRDLYRGAAARTGSIDKESQLEQPEAVPDQFTPLCVYTERLRLVYASDPMLPHVAVVFALCAHLRKRPEQIVSDFQSIPLGEIARYTISEYSRLSGISEKTLSSVLVALRDIQAGDFARSCLCEFWDPSQVVAGWIADVNSRFEQEAPLESPANPNQKLAWILNLRLAYSVDEIVLMGDETLDSLFVRARREMAAKEKCTPEEIQQRYLCLETPEGPKANKELRTYFQPAKTVSHWIDTVNGRLRRAELRQCAEGIGFLSPEMPPRSAIAFLNHVLLHKPALLHKPTPEMSAAALHPLDMRQALTYTEEACASSHNTPVKSVHSWFSDLRNQVNQIVAELFAGTRTQRELALWISSEVRPAGLEILKRKIRDRKGPVLFAWRHNLLKEACGESGARPFQGVEDSD